MFSNPRRPDRDYKPQPTPAEKRAWAAGYRQGRHRGRIDAWQEWTGHRIPGADPIPALEAAPDAVDESFRKVERPWTALRNKILRRRQ